MTDSLPGYRAIMVSGWRAWLASMAQSNFSADMDSARLDTLLHGLAEGAASYLRDPLSPAPGLPKGTQLVALAREGPPGGGSRPALVELLKAGTHRACLDRIEGARLERHHVVLAPTLPVESLADAVAAEFGTLIPAAALRETLAQRIADASRGNG